MDRQSPLQAQKTGIDCGRIVAPLAVLLRHSSEILYVAFSIHDALTDRLQL